MRLTFRLLVPALAGLSAACSDTPTAVRTVPFTLRGDIGEVPLSPHGPERGTSPYFCTASRAVKGTSTAYQYGIREVRFPKSELAPDGSSTVYRVVSYGGDGEIAGRASCLIPNTDAARARIERLFRTSPRGRSTPGATIQSEPAPIEGVDVYACRYGGEYPHCNYEPPLIGAGNVECTAYESCGTGSGGDPYASDGWSWGSAGGDGSEPPPPDDGTGRKPCERDVTRYCVTEAVDSLELAQITQRITAMKETPAECALAKQYAQELLAQGPDRFLVWNGYDIYLENGRPRQRLGYNSSDQKGRILVFDSYWLFYEPTLVAHEALHNYLHRINSPLTGKANEDWVDEWAQRCA